MWSYVTQLQYRLFFLLLISFFFNITYCDLQQLSLCCLSSVHMVGLWKAWKQKKKDHSRMCCSGNTEAVS